MCVAGGDCGTSSSCVAGRCVARGAVVAIANAKRLLFEPVEVGYVRRGGPSALDGQRAPSVATLGGADGAMALLRFAVVLPPEANVLEAYVLLERAPGVDPEPQPIALHLAPVIDGWEGRTLSWATQPRTVEVGAPVTRVLPAASGPVRLDVRAIVERWRRRSGDAQGIAIVGTGGGEGGDASGDAGVGAGGSSRRGVAFALAPSSAGERVSAAGGVGPDGHEAREREASEPVAGPRLELYVR